jgi:DNA polymerase-3 subunit epsilon
MPAQPNGMSSFGFAADKSIIEGGMLHNIILEKPLAFIDLETTGTDPKKDRIVEISVLKILPDGQQQHRTRRINPGMPIPAAATAVHGIEDADVAGEPRFEQVANALLHLLDGCDLCGFNLKRFDLRVLYCEFRRANRQLSLEGRSLIDPMEIFYRYEPRNLAAAMQKYLSRDYEDGHSASADVLATVEVLDAMVARYPDLPHDVSGLHQHLADPDRIDSDGFFRRIEGEVRFLKGKHRGEPLAAVAATSPDYLEWMLTQDFFDDTRAVVREALAAVRATRTVVNCPALSVS